MGRVLQSEQGTLRAGTASVLGRPRVSRAVSAGASAPEPPPGPRVTCGMDGVTQCQGFVRNQRRKDLEVSGTCEAPRNRRHADALGG